MNENVKRAILDKIRAYDRIIIMRHFRPDGDAVGSTKGLARILKLTFPEKEILVINEDYAAYLAFLGEEDAQRPDEDYRDALGICVDTGTVGRLSNPKYALCREIVKIDHHIDDEPYGDVSWVEDRRSAACEMIADLWRTFPDELKMDREAATYLYTGLVTDTGRFKFSCVSGDTMRLAGMLLDFGIDLDTLHANLYLEELEVYRRRAAFYERVKETESGVVWLYVDREMQETFGLSQEDASATVSLLEGIRGDLIWIAFIETDDNIRVRLRSRFIEIKELASRYHGGGHACAAGATVYSADEMERLVKEADAMLKDYKENNEGWL